MFARLISFIFGFFILSSAQAMVIVGFDGEPFYFKNGSEGVAGTCHEIMQKLCDHEKIHCKFKIAPLPMVLEMMKSGKADATCPLSDTLDRQDYIAFSNKVFRTRFSFFAMPETAKKITTLKDLGGRSIGVFTPSRVSESLDEIREKAPVKFEIIKENSNFSTLMRAEKISKVLAYMNHEIAIRWIAKTHSPLVEAPLEGEELAYNIGFSKRNYPPERLAGFIKTVQEIVASKEMKESAQKAGLTLWDETPAPAPGKTPQAIVPASATPTPTITPSPLDEMVQ
jgi:ABC-type amino acid transport substrate-binding protein